MAISLKALLNEAREISGKPLSPLQALRYAEQILESISPAPRLATEPRLLTSPDSSNEPPDNLTAIAIVLGSQTLNVAQITKLLQDRGWLHNRSNRSIRYVSDLLSRNSQGKGTNRFVRIRPGVYKVAKARPRLVYRTGP